MSRPMSMLLAAAVAATSVAISVPSTASEPQGAIQLVGDSHGGDWNDSWRDTRRHWRHQRPGFSFEFGAPLPRVHYRHQRPRDCYRHPRDGSLTCRGWREPPATRMD
jgi:hypothetical protein